MSVKIAANGGNAWVLFELEPYRVAGDSNNSGEPPQRGSLLIGP